MANNIKLKILAIFLLAFFTFSCGTTKISCPENRAEIYMDQSYIGTGLAEVPSMGLPKTAYLEARYGGRIIGKTTMSRSFTFGTFWWGLISYYSGFLWAWYYPDNVIIPLIPNYLPGSEYKSLWDNPRESIWMKPMSSVK